MIRLPVGADQEQSPPDLTTGNGIQSENICTEIPSLRESAPKPTIKTQEPSSKTAPALVDVVEQDIQNQRRTSHRLSTANRNDAVGTTSTLSSTRSINDQGNMRNSEQRMSASSDPSSTATSIICSLPLNKLESILGMLNGMKKNPDHTADLVSANAVLRDHDQNNSSPAGSDSTHDAPNDNSLVYKVLCLYCDRSFTNQKLMIKHTDRIHRIAKDRRSSARVLSTALNGSDVSSCCHFCHKGKTLNLMSENLPELFKHLISVHSDRYYACAHCTIRFPSDEAREAHMEALHPSTNSRRPKSKAALKAFSHGQNSCTLHHPQPVVSVVNCKTFKTAGVPRSEATEPLSTMLELCSRSIDRLVVNNNSINNSSTKGESAVQNICLRSSLRNATAPTVEKDAANCKPKSKAFKKSERLLRRNSEPMLLSRLGITQHRLPRQSRRLLAAASTTANASLLSSDTTSASSISSTSSAMGSDDVQPVQNCYNKITKLKTIRSTLSTNPMVSIADGSVSNNGSNGSTVMLATNSGIFDEDFYETVTQNVKNNLSCHLDGKLEASTPYAPSPMSPVSVVPAVRSTVVKSPVSTDSKIHEATNLPTVSVMFPTLLTVEQYGTDPKPTTSTATVASVSSASSVKTKKTVTKNSWKWKWDFVKKYKYVNENGRIVKKIKQPTVGLRDLSKLDMWTQLTMRTKHELFQHRRTSDDQRQLQASSATKNDSAKEEPMIIAEVGATLRHEKRAMVEQLDQILDARLLPHIDLEQNDQRIIKIEPSDEHPIDDKAEINIPPMQCSTLVPWSNTQSLSKNMDFLHNLQLIQLNRHHQNSPVVLSGEWARPRCYICYGCGAKFNSLKQVEEHRIFRHPHVHSTFYEIVGRELIEKRLYKHFFIPVIALMMQKMHCMRLGKPDRVMNSAIMHGMIPQHAGVCRINTVTEIKNEDSSSNEATSFSTSTSASSSSSSSSSLHSANTTVTTLMDTCSDAINVLSQYSVRSVICSKCQKECQNQILLYAHILHCSNDYVWLQAKKRMKYRRAKRRRGGNRSVASCAPAMLTMPRMIQPQPNLVEKVDSIGYVTSVNEKHGLNEVVTSNSSLNNISLSSNVSSSSDSTCGSSSTSNNSSINSTDLSKVNSNQKVRRSPKPKENDSDIVKKLLANLPAKRNSRETNSPTSIQINKRSRVISTSGGQSSGNNKPRKKKLNDCIAMLTGKLSQQLGVDFFNNEKNRGEVYPTESAASCSTSEPEKLVIKNTTTSSCSLSSDECSSFKEDGLVKEQNVQIHSMLPAIAPNNNSNTSSSVQVDTAASSTPTVSSNEYRQALTALPPQTAPIHSGSTIAPKMGAGNFSSLKLPPGLIIERVEYKQSRPSITKEVPSVTIVARQLPGTSMLGPIDMQRLAAVRLPAHLQPPVIPPLKIPDAATSATLLEKIFHPTHSDALSTGLELKTDAHYGNKTERQNKNECLLDLMSSKKMKIPENISKAISQNRHNVEEQHQHNTVAVALNVQEAIEAKLQNAQKENNVQLQNKPEDCNIALTHTVDNTNDSNTTLGQDHSIKGINPPASLSAIDTADMMKTVDKIDAASEDGSVDTIDCQVSADTQKPALKKIARKRRKNELASILSDQLLESFKEVDKSRLDDLKLLHDLTCETPDVKFTLEQIPQLAKRKSNPRLPELVMQETSNIKATSLNITTKKGQNTKRQPKEKEQISLSTVKEVKNKPSNDTIDSGEPNEVKSVQIQERKEDGFVNSGNDMKDKCALQNEPLETKKSTGDLGSSTEQELAKHKATRSKTQTTFSGEHGSHNSPRRSLTRATNSELNADVVANDRTADINIQDRKSLLRKRNIAPAAEIVQSCEKNNFTNSIDNAETANSLTGSNNRSTEMVSHKNVDTTPTPPIIAEKASSNPPKRIMSRRKSVFVDCDLALYVEKEEEKLKKESTNVSFKDDFMLTSRRGTRSQGQLGLDLVESLAEATMKPRDPRRRMLQKRREEEFNARENKIQLQIKNDPPIPVEEQTADVIEKQTKSVSSNSIAAKGKKLVTNEFDSSVDTNAKNDKEILFSIGTEGHAPLRRISARRASVCVRPLTDSKNVKGHDMSTMTALPEDDHLRDIGNEVKRIYKRRASIYQPTPDLQQEDKNKKETTPQKSHNRRSKTPGPGDCKRRKQLPLNGTSEPLIESLLLHAPDSESNAPKRRTTKNSQIAETVSKLFNIQEEIMLIDSSRRKPRKVNFPSVSTQPELSVQEQQKETLDSTNEGTGMEKGIERCKGLSSYELPMVGNEGIEKKSPPHIPRKSFSFSNDEDESPKAIKKMVENIINNTTNSSNASTDYSDDDNMSLAYFAARNNAPVTNLGQSTDNFLKPPSSTPVRAMSVIADDESTTCTDALDDDMMSVTTEIPPSSNASRMGTSRVRRKRRKSRRQNSKIKRQQTKTQEENNKPVQSFNCILCRKMFKKHDAFNKHRMTLSHIAKLSEQEYLVSQQNQERRENKSLLEPKENIQLQPNPDDNQRTEKVDEPNANSMDAPELVPTTPNGNLAMASLQMKMTDNNKLHGNQSVKELSQEEKLFFECCSMLKESNAGESDELKRVTVSLETNELLTSSDSISPCVVFTDKSTNVSATGASVNLPLVEQNQTSPVSMTCCVEEFVATQVTNIRQQEQEGTGTPQNHERLREGANFMVQRYVVANVARNTSPHNSIKSSSTMPTATTSSSISSNSSSSTSSSSSRSSSCSDSNTVSKNNANNAKIKTKGALKGYDNFKVSIPMTGVAVGKESRLDTLADVALCGDIPKEFGIEVQSHEINAATLVRVDERVRDDIYAFQDSPCDGDLPSTYSSKKNSNTMQNQGMMKNEESNQQQQVKQNATITASLEEHDDSQMSSLSFSDRDDFVYGTNTMSEEEEEEDDKNSSISSEQTTPKKLTNADVQKKSLIMGRIFKKGGAKDKFVGDVGVRKSSTTSPEEPPVAEVPHKAAGTPVTASKPATTLKSAVKDFDKLFDTLKNDAVSANELQNNNDTVSDIRHAASPGEEILVATMGVKDKLAECQTNNSDHPYHPGRNDFGTINTGTDRLRRRRAGQQKILTETWDSDEFEDIQKDDIMRLINRTEDDEVIDNTLSTRRIPLHKTTDEKTKSGNLECISTDRLKQSSSLNDISNNENHRIEQMLDKHAGSKQGIHSLFDKKPLKFDTTTVTDDTIRKVMESVILETMGKSCNSNKRKPTTAHAPTLGTDSTAASNSKVLRVSSNTFEMTSLEEHTLEPSVVISSKTITSKFKQKLNSSMRYNLTEIEGVSDSYEKEPMSRQSKLATNTSSISDTNSGTNIKLATNNKEDWIGKTPVASGKQRKVAPKKMKNIAYDPDSDYEQSIKCKKVKRKLLENDIEANLKIEQLQSTLLNVEDSSILLTTPRRKRNAGDMLYYWSSSSDEEIEKEEKTGRTKRHGDITEDRRRHCKPINNNNVTVGKKRGRKKKQTQLESMNSIELITDDVKKQDASDSEKDETKSKSTLLSQPTTITTEASLIEVSAKKSRTNTGSTDKKVGIVPKTKKQLDTERSLQIQTLPVQTDEETCGTSSEHLQQHGWIMGDSHKKLVTMLAHAKGKHDSRKQSTTNRKK
ncbi:serine-rich adhesin for platelets [Anopheles marshallii]|uniref:serine-rich adhesin for platelets n=1 Tax=Anopheles marshallii TaxID=1521116 RepID=UPI00237B57F8|nr:serine-rich adhesin for platelets [Anopheles marshallii]